MQIKPGEGNFPVRGAPGMTCNSEPKKKDWNYEIDDPKVTLH